MSENIQRKIARLLERAAHPGTEEHERSACMAKADRLMAEYKVERSTISWEHVDKERKPIVVDRPGRVLSYDDLVMASRRDGVEHSIQGVVTSMRRLLFQFAGCRTRLVHANGDSTLKVIGYEEDIYYADYLWNMTFSEILKTMYPSWNRTNPVAQNIYEMKSAGYSWPQVRVAAIENGAELGGVAIDDKNAASKLRTGYRQWARHIGVPEEMPNLRDPQHWRHSYISGFSSRLQQRCAALKQGRDEFFDGQPNQIALRNDSAKVDDIWEEMFGEQDRAAQARWEEFDRKNPPKKSRAVAVKTREADMSAWRAGVSSASKVKLSSDSSLKNKKEIG